MTYLLALPLTPAERQLIDQAAAFTGQSAEEFAIATLVRAAATLRNNASKGRGAQKRAIEEIARIPIDPDAQRRPKD